MNPLEPALAHLSPVLDQDSSRQILRKVTVRLIPFLCLLYAFNILDRTNVGFARLTMQNDLGLSQVMFDIGYGLFYFGYFVFEVPSNLLLSRLGARRWIGRIMISWGLVSCATLAVTDAWSFYLLRILLGIAEAGFFPGIILYLTYWFPARERARVMAFFMTAIGLASVVGNPLSGAIMEYLHEEGGLRGWQWLFLLEGIPSVLLGFITLYWLTDRPEVAHWLTAGEKSWLVAQMRQEEFERQQRHKADRLGAMWNGRVWLLIAVYFTVATGANASGAYFPKLIANHFDGYSIFQIGLLSALPHVGAIFAMTLFSAHSDRTGERRGHVAFAALTAASGWALSTASGSPALVLLGLCLAQVGMMSMLPTFWTLPTAFLSGAAAAGGIALINSVANVGGFFGPVLLGQLGAWSMAITLIIGAGLALFVRHEKHASKTR